MTITVAASDAVGFGITAVGFSYNFAGNGAPAVGQIDVLFVNSDALVNTPAGFTLAASNVGQQGAYAFIRQAIGGEAATVTLSTSSGAGPFNAELGWARLTQADGMDKAVIAFVDVNPGTTSPAVSTGSLAGTTEAVLVFAALHNIPGATPTAPVWSAAYAGLQSVSQGAGATGVAGFLAFKTPAGHAAEAPSVSWTNSASDRYILAATFVESAACPACPPSPTCVCDATLNLTSFAPLVTGVASCVITALGLTPAGVPCRQCLLLPTSVIPWDACSCDNACNGQIGFAITDVFGSSTFPTPAAAKDWSHCGPAWQVARIKASIVRCVPTVDESGQPPTCAEELAAALTLETDRMTVRSALACCLEASKTAHTIGAWLLEPSITVGESGGCAGSETTFLVALRSCLCGQT